MSRFTSPYLADTYASVDNMKREVERELRDYKLLFAYFHPIPLNRFFSFGYRSQRRKLYLEWLEVVSRFKAISKMGKSDPWYNYASNEEMALQIVVRGIGSHINMSSESKDKLAKLLCREDSPFPFDWQLKVLSLLDHPQVPGDDYELLLLLTFIDGSVDDLVNLVELPHDYLYHMLGEG